MRASLSRPLVVATALCVMAAGLQPPRAQAQNAANDLADLNYQALDRSHGELSRRGYVRQSAEGGSSDRYEQWWNSSRNRCVTVHAQGGKVASVVETSAIDCGQSGSGSRGGSNDAAAAVAIGAAALLGIAALSHKSHHHDDNQHYSDQNDESDFERGYRDGLYNYSYSDRAGENYNRGFSAGMRDRESRTPYRGDYPSHGSNLNDLIGARAAGADTQMRARGFVDRGARQHDGQSQVFWWNDSSRECVRVSTANGRIDSIRSVDRDRCN